ncbi:hypothetical protein RND81_04G099300 [Saponaria officinalis]|uniref:Transmembrane protein n=1 Tax=Saponaria officinalis TaxID=3572 RepID=A0AAW1LJK2_SAPOF
MASSSIGYGVLPLSSLHSQTHNFSFKHSQFFSSNSSSFCLPTQILFPNLRFSGLSYPKSHGVLPSISALQSNFFKVAQTVFNIGKDGVEAGTKLVPDAVPRPVARLSVTVVAATLSLFVLKSFLSTVFFALGVMGFVYFVYIALNKDKGTKVDEKPGSTDEAIEQAQKIMDKYK